MTDTAQDWIMDWNRVEAPAPPATRVHVHDETLRDGLQSPSIVQPTLDQRLELLHFMNQLGVDSADLGMPVSNPSASEHVRRLCAEIAECRLQVTPVCAARTVHRDIAAVAEVSQATGLELWVMAFVGISPIRMYVEGWSPDAITKDVAEVVAFARAEGLRVCLVTEDTTRSRPEVAAEVYTAAMEAGAERICICDTVGYAVPWGAETVVRQIRRCLADRGFGGTGVDWHGHNDRGLAIANSIAAAAAGADRLHGTALGTGERAGNAPMEQLLINLSDLGWREGDLTGLPAYCQAAARACSLTMPANQPFVGQDAYRTAAGVHAAAIRKARATADTWLAERVYAGVPANMIGRTQRIEIGPGSGRANVLCWLEDHGIPPDAELLAALERIVAGATRVLTDAEIYAAVGALIRSVPAGPGASSMQR